MTSTTMTSACSADVRIDFCNNTYTEDILEQRKEPQSRSLSLILHLGRLKWHLKGTFDGTLQSTQGTFARVTKRRKDLRNLFDCLDFDHNKLFNDTVTELTITRYHYGCTTQGQRVQLRTELEPESEYCPFASKLWLSIREDPSRVFFPVYKDSGYGTLTKHVSDIQKGEELDLGVHVVLISSDQKPCVYKEIDRPLYNPNDSDVVEQELRNLEILRAIPEIRRLVAAVISENPYHTNPAMIPTTVLRGILLEYHPKGTLQDALQCPKPYAGGVWRGWALQIATALYMLHICNITHMDLKPSNIVISDDNAAKLIDVSGIGGVTEKYVSAEMADMLDPLLEDLNSRKMNDIWALGEVLSEMVNASNNEEEKELLRSVAKDATASLSRRISLPDVIDKLSEPTYQL